MYYLICCFSPMFKTHGTQKCLVIIQCDSGHLNGDLIACARYRIYDLMARIDEGQTTHVLFVIHLPQQVASSSFVGFQGDPWISAHIDDLRPPSDNTVAPNIASTITISELFMGKSARLQTEQVEPPYTDFWGSDMEEDGFNGSKEMEASGSLENSGEYNQNSDMQSDGEDLTATDSEGEERESSFQKKHWAERNLNPRMSEMGMEMEEESRPHDDSLMSVDDIEDKEIAVTTPTLRSRENHTELVTISSVEHSSIRPRNDTKLTEASQIVLAETDTVESSRISPLYSRLHGCIQAAAAKLKDDACKRSTKRVQLLVRLIPKDMSDLGMNSA